MLESNAANKRSAFIHPLLGQVIEKPNLAFATCLLEEKVELIALTDF